ncbi:MAG: hypothetical protein M1831_004390 [Alyxoria varia]|nr:MAG: hypothetical protein M1831_004390 [Alyxoria varia]
MASWFDDYLSNLEVRDNQEKANETSIRSYTILANQHSDLHKAISKSVPPPHTFPDDQINATTSQPRRSASSSSSTYPEEGSTKRPSSRTKLPLPPSIVGSAPPAVPPESARDHISTGSARNEAVVAAELRADLANANRHLADLSSHAKSLESTTIPHHESTIATQQSQIARLQSQLSELKDGHASQLSTLRKEKDVQISKLEREKASSSRKLRDRESEAREKDQLLRRTQDEMVSLEMQVNVSDEKLAALERENERIIEKLGQQVGKDVDR